jgi:ABC-type transport system involved in multi-copper enzyme maturation permease subunit
MICDEFNDRTVGLSLFSGFARRNLLGAKVAMVFLGTVILTSLMPIIMLVSATVLNEFGGSFSELFLPMLRDLGLYYLGNLALASLFCLIAYSIRSAGGSLGVSIGLGMVLNLAGEIPVAGFQKIYKFVFVRQLMSVGSPDLNIPFYVVIMVVTLIVLVLASVAVFEKSDLK